MKLVLIQLPIIQQAYIKSNLDFNSQEFYIQPLFYLISLFCISYESIVKIKKLLYNILKTGNHSFGIYHPHYKEKLVSNPTQTFSYIINCFYFLCNFDNLFATFLILASNNRACIALLGLVTKKAELPRTLIYLFSHFFQTLFFLLILTLTSFFLLANYLSMNLTGKIFLIFFVLFKQLNFYQIMIMHNSLFLYIHY